MIEQLAGTDRRAIPAVGQNGRARTVSAKYPGAADKLFVGFLNKYVVKGRG